MQNKDLQFQVKALDAINKTLQSRLKQPGKEIDPKELESIAEQQKLKISKILEPAKQEDLKVRGANQEIKERLQMAQLTALVGGPAEAQQLV